MFIATTALALLQEDTGGAAAALITLISLVFQLTLMAVVIAAMWKIFAKAGLPGWGALIPLYNTYLLLKLVGRPGWWLLLLFVPFVNFIVAIIALFDLARAFGKGTGFGLGLLFLGPIFLMILGFGDARYVGPVAASPRPAMA